MTSASSCPFCTRIDAGDLAVESRHAVAIPDAYPVGPGHTLVVPRRHVADVFGLEGDEYLELWELVRSVRDRLRDELDPDGFNLGVNIGAAAGQTVDHAHVHVIPRFDGDRDDPRGGVRWVLPDAAAYWDDDG